MLSRRTARAAVISTAVLVLTTIAAPALAGHDDPDGPYPSEETSEDYGSDERAGRSPDIDIQVECTTVDVTSPKKISTVTVYFADGTEEVIEVDERGYSGTFETTIDHALAETHNDYAVDDAEGCEPEPSPSPSGSASDETEDTGTGSDTQTAHTTESDTQSDGTTRSSNPDSDGTSTGTRTTSTSAGSSEGTSTGTGGATAPAVTAPASAPAIGFSMVTGGNTHVLGMAFHQGLKKCPSGPHKGMPYLKLSDCGDSVLGIRLALTGMGVGWFAVLGFVLIGIGTALLRVRRASVAA